MRKKRDKSKEETINERVNKIEGDNTKKTEWRHET